MAQQPRGAFDWSRFQGDAQEPVLQQSPTLPPSGAFDWSKFQDAPTEDEPLDLNLSDETSSARGWIGPALGAAGVAAAGLALRNPALARTLLQKFADARRTAMLYGWALPKSMLGNIGAVAAASAERGSLAPLREFFSPQTARDVVQNIRAGGRGAYGTYQTTNPLVPGHYMGAFDEATGAALSRAGFSPEEVQRELLQKPLPRAVTEKYEAGGPLSTFLMPFPRIPYNWVAEGVETYRPVFHGVSSPEDVRKLATLAGATGVGVASGAATEGQGPLPLALTSAATGRYGLPTAIGQAAGRYLATGKKSQAQEATRGISPISDYGLIEAMGEPTRPFTRPFERLRRLLGID